MDVTLALFYRDGRAFTGKPQQDEKNKPFVLRQTKCSRCGGAGGAAVWAATGWTCFQCGGNGRGPVVTDRLYTAEQLQKMNSTRDKRQAKKVAAQAEKAAALETERAAKRATFQETHKDILALATGLADPFFTNMAAECIERASISAAQINLINRRIAEIAQKAASNYVGTVGERREFTCKLEKFFDWSGKFTKYCHIMRDENGQVIKYIGSKVLGGVKWQGERGNYYPVVDNTETLRFTATITEHVAYNWEKQTVIARPKAKEAGENIVL